MHGSLECKAWNAKCRLARAKNAQPGLELVIKMRGWSDLQQWPREHLAMSAHPKVSN